jgi:hypothetical protein
MPRQANQALSFINTKLNENRPSHEVLLDSRNSFFYWERFGALRERSSMLLVLLNTLIT